MQDINIRIAQLVSYAQAKGLVGEEDLIWARNGLLSVLGLDRYDAPEAEGVDTLENILKDILDWAVETGRIEAGPASRDLLDTALMAVLTPRPSLFCVLRTME